MQTVAWYIVPRRAGYIGEARDRVQYEWDKGVVVWELLFRSLGRRSSSIVEVVNERELCWWMYVKRLSSESSAAWYGVSGAYEAGSMKLQSDRNIKMTTVGFEPTPFQTSALNWRLRPLGQVITPYCCIRLKHLINRLLTLITPYFIATACNHLPPSLSSHPLVDPKRYHHPPRYRPLPSLLPLLVSPVP
jgi:hypothetical protein